MDWRSRVAEHLERHFSRAERNAFLNAILVEVHDLGHGYTPAHNKERCQIAFELQKIRAMITKYAGPPKHASDATQ
jgi:hypothetical protein